ncbi:hypothetical protein E2C01_061370 [Portunus trituberculatus]|uniref:Uncharacterized protein n=1 Tax=Portunus trituberculatus TaxID=210409 RepID=A0A5B7H7X6_PORTR|nr:hypothetical protein [Portunus trituberculatus]
MKMVAYAPCVGFLLVALLLAVLQSPVFTVVAASDQKDCTTTTSSSITIESVSYHEPESLASTPSIKIFKW